MILEHLFHCQDLSFYDRQKLGIFLIYSFSYIALQGSTAGCPREPWHDLHCRIDGPAAYDILTNFEERWLKASKPHGIQKMKTSSDDSLLKLDRIPDVLGIKDVSTLHEDNPEAWHVQV